MFLKPGLHSFNNTLMFRKHHTVGLFTKKIKNSEPILNNNIRTLVDEEYQLSENGL